MHRETLSIDNVTKITTRKLLNEYKKYYFNITKKQYVAHQKNKTRTQITWNCVRVSCHMEIFVITCVAHHQLYNSRSDNYNS